MSYQAQAPISPDYIHQIGLMANKNPTRFILKVLEGGGWGLTTKF